MIRPTEDDLGDAAEIGRCGCLLPDCDDGGLGDDEGDDDE